MPFSPDPEFLAAFALIATGSAGVVPPPVGDVAVRRQTVEATQITKHNALGMPDDVEVADRAATTSRRRDAAAAPVHIPVGTPASVAECVAPYVDAGVTAPSFIPFAAWSRAAIVAVAEVRTQLVRSR